MCNHYEKNVEVISWAAGFFGVTHDLTPVSVEGDVLPVPYEAWPKWKAPVVYSRAAGPVLTAMRWGVSVKVNGKLNNVTNARDDKLAGYPWRYAVAERRCLIPASAYFEPGLGPPGARGEIRFAVRDRPCFFIAGLWDQDDGVDGERGFTLVTTKPNDYAARFHDRMPVVLSDSDAREWLGHAPLAPDRLAALCRGAPSEILQHTDIAAVPRKKVTKTDLQASDGELLF